MDGAELGESRECSSFQDACETLAIGMTFLFLIWAPDLRNYDIPI